MDKAPDAFRTISEVAESLDVPQHVLRFWETRFSQIKPMKRSGGRRYYRREDVELLRGIRHLLYGEGYTIRGVQRILREQGIKAVQGWEAGGLGDPGRPEPRDEHEPAFEVEGNGPDPHDMQALEREADQAPAARGSVVRLMREELTVGPPAAPEVIIVNRISPENVALLRGALNDLMACRALLERAAAG